MKLMEALLNLNRVDAQVRGLRSRLDSASIYLNAQQRQHDELNERRAELETRQKQTRATIGNAEVELKAIDERIEKLRGELNGSATTKQYNAVLAELDTVKTQRSELEDRMLTEMSNIEELDAGMAEIDEQLKERAKVRDQAKSDLAERESDVGERLAELEAERATAAESVPSNARVIFDELSEVYDGEAMAHVDEINRRHRTYVCGECNIQLPFEQVSLLLSGSDTLVQCPACSRILHIQQDLRGALVKD